MDFSSIIVNISLTLFLIIGLIIFIVSNRQVDGKTSRYFIIFIGVVCLLLFFDSWEYYLARLSYLNEFRYFTTAMCYILRIVVITVMNIWLYPGKKNRYLLLIPAFVLAVFALSNKYTHLICYFDENNQFLAGKMRFLPHVFAGFCLIILMIHVLIKVKKNEFHMNLLFCFSVLMNVFSAVMETIYDIKFLLTGTMMIFCIFYYSMINKQNETRRAKIQEREIANSKIAIMLSQIQPHFLYNVLSTIRALCRRNPQMAEKATIEFTEFLRQNMDSLTADRPISFEKELIHTKHYLNLEKIRFPNKLHIVYDIGPVLFSLPTLTLQPVVENAVRYGVTKRVEGGTVTITTKETENAYVIIVSDDGVGFDLQETKNDGRSHIGIYNVKTRLASMCNGKLTIVSTVLKGTTVTIEIPKEKRNNADLYCR